MTRTHDDLPYRAMRELCAVVSEEFDREREDQRREMVQLVEDHEERLHRLPQRRTTPVTAVPFPGWELDDAQTARAIEMLQNEHATLEDAALAIGCPSLVLEREIARYRPPYRSWVRSLGMG